MIFCNVKETNNKILCYHRRIYQKCIHKQRKEWYENKENVNNVIHTDKFYLVQGRLLYTEKIRTNEE